MFFRLFLRLFELLGQLLWWLCGDLYKFVFRHLQRLVRGRVRCCLFVQLFWRMWSWLLRFMFLKLHRLFSLFRPYLRSQHGRLS